MLQNRYNHNTQTGMYRNRILIRRRVLTQDDLLQEIETFEDYGRYWARIITVHGREYFAAAQEKQNNTSRFIIKYSTTLEQLIQSDKTSFEIEYKNNVYDVKDVYNDNELDLTVTIVAEARV